MNTCHVKSCPWILIAYTLLLVCLSPLFGLNLELQVKECAGVGSSGFPITTVVPLPRGAYQDIGVFRLTDAAGSTIPAQFNILNRRWIDDNSIANLSIEYQPSVSPFSGAGTGISKYYLRDDATGAAASTELRVSDASGVITVITGPLKLVVNKTVFNLLDQVFLDKNGDKSFSSDEQIVSSANRNGGEFIGRLPGDVQWDADRTDVKVEIEESGPMRVVIRAESVTKYYSTINHTHGWAVRLYAFAGKSYIKIDYQLQNSAKTKSVAWPLYFHALNINLALKMGTNPIVRAGLGNGTVYERVRNNGISLAQERDSLFRVYGAGRKDTLASGKYPDGFLDIDDGDIGVTAITRYFWQMWPNGLAVDSTNRLTVQLWPEWSAQLRGKVPVRPLSSNHWYWLFDMEHAYKEVVLNFHKSGLSNPDLINLAKTVTFHPVATYSTAWCGEAKASLDMEGMIPYTIKKSVADSRVPAITDKTNVGWAYFSLRGRRDETAAPGGWPLGQGNFFVTENPADYYLAEWSIMGDLNARPHSMSQYSFQNDFSALRLGTNTVSGAEVLAPPFVVNSWRAFKMGGGTNDTAFLPETWDDVDPLDNAHAWYYHLQDCYYITGNPWQRDWYKFIGEFRKVATYGNKTLEQASRSVAHSFDNALQAFKAVGDTDITSKLYNVVKGDLRNSYSPRFGQRNSACCGSPPNESPYQAGFLIRFLINLMNESRDPQVYADCFQIISGVMHWNLTYANFSAGTWAPKVTNSYVSGNMLADAQAWYYWNTGKKEYLNHLLSYLDNGLLGGTRPDGITANAGKTANWSGEFEGRWVQRVRTGIRTDTMPPPPVSDLKISRAGKTCTLQWTGIKEGRRYHIVWGDKPIVEKSTEDGAYLNWWGANAIGPHFLPTEGVEETITFALPDTGYSLVFAAVFSFDSAGNMSRMSNLATTDGTPPTAVTGLRTNLVSAANANLVWQPSSDPESGIWWYTILRNGIKITAVDANLNSFIDNGLKELTDYQYVVSAVNGSLAEGGADTILFRTPADTAAPVILTVSAIDTLSRVKVAFNERIEKTSAEDPANYLLDKGRLVKSAVLQNDGRTVILICDSLMFGESYMLTVSKINDIADSPNRMEGVGVPFIYKRPFVISIVTRDRTGSIVYGMDTVLIGKYVYMDDAFAISQIPSGYAGLPLLRTLNEPDVALTGDSVVVFDVNKEVKVFVAYDDSQTGRGRKPAWLGSFTDNGANISVLSPSGRTWTFSLHEKLFPAGRVKLGGNNGITDYSTYFAIVLPTDSSWVDNDDGDLPEETEAGIYAHPNPFNPAVRITVVFDGIRTGRQALRASLGIFNMQGRKVAELQPVSFIAGKRTRLIYVWNASGYGSGLYLVKVSASGKTMNKKITIIR